jgi:GxxExxY protein
MMLERHLTQRRRDAEEDMEHVPLALDCPEVVPLAELNRVSGEIVDAAMHIHRTLGPGLLESVYQAVLAYELRKRGLHVETEVPVPVIWEEVRLDTGFRADLIVDRLVVVELKALEAAAPVHKKQLLTHLRLTDKRLGLLINFGAALLKDGITRVANGIRD